MKKIALTILVLVFVNVAQANETLTAMTEQALNVCNFLLSTDHGNGFTGEPTIADIFHGISHDQESLCLETLADLGNNFDIDPYLSQAGRVWLHEFTLGSHFSEYDPDVEEDAMGRVDYDYDVSDLPTFDII